MKAIIISIGNELLNGRTMNSNATFIGSKLYEIGISTQMVITIRDDAQSISNNLHRALQECDLVFLTGGLGPTHDDITKKVVTEFFDARLIYDEAIVRRIEEKFNQRGLKMPEVNREQGYVPDKATIIPNALGTAPGLHFEKSGKHVFVMPGVPREMKSMMTETIIPKLQKEFLPETIQVRVYRTTRVAESRIYELCEQFLKQFPDYEIAFLPKFTGVDIRVAIKPSAKNAEMLAEFEHGLYERIGNYIYTEGDRTLEIGVGDLLKERNLTVSVAESCTGGLLQHKITQVSGSSAYFLGGLVTYSNQSKIKFAAVKKASLEKYGAVSEAVAKEMAAGVRKAFATDIALSTTGIAGPGGGTVEKPVGLVYIGLATTEKVIAKKFNLGKNRNINKEQSAQFALDMLRRELIADAAK